MTEGRLSGFRFLRRRVIAAAAMVGVPFALGVQAACGGDAPTVKSPATTHDEGVRHEACDGRIVALDTNNDGRPDLQRVFGSDGREQCRIVDLDHDGKPDMYEYFDAQGAVRRREFCYGDRGAIAAVETLQAGRLVSREYDISGQHRIDTWDYFDPNAPIDPKIGRPAHPSRRERDTTGDGRVDQWWSWNGDTLTIAVDRDGDGKPDPDATIVLDANGAAAAAAGGSDAGASALGASSSDSSAPASTLGASTSDSGAPASTLGASSLNSSAPASTLGPSLEGGAPASSVVRAFRDASAATTPSAGSIATKSADGGRS